VGEHTVSEGDAEVWPSLRDVLRAFFRQRLTILLVFFSAIAGAAAYCVLANPIYESDVRVLVKLGTEQMSGVVQQSQPAYNVLFQERAQNINNEIEILKKLEIGDAGFQKLKHELRRLELQREATPMRQLRESFWRGWGAVRSVLLAPLYSTGLLRRLTPDLELARDIRAALRFEPVEETDTIKISFRWDDADFAALALGHILTAYLAEHTRVHQSEASHRFFVDQIALWEGRLRQSEAALSGFMEASDVANLELQKDLLLRSVADLEDRQARALVSLETTRQRLRRVDEQAAAATGWVDTPILGLEASSPLNAALQQLDEAYFKIGDEKRRLLATFQPDSRQVKGLDERMDGLRRQKANSLVSVLSTQIATDESLLARLGAELKESKHRLALVSSRTLKLRQLEREREVAEKSFLLYRGKTEELRINDDLAARQITSVRVVGQPNAPTEPVGPRKGLVLGLAGLLGVVLGLGIAALRELFDHTFRDGADVERVLGVPLLLNVPLWKGAELKR
jgi:uncharacterized protein involved in exopolysaccharide biosynthesis